MHTCFSVSVETDERNKLAFGGLVVNFSDDGDGVLHHAEDKSQVYGSKFCFHGRGFLFVVTQKLQLALPHIFSYWLRLSLNMNCLGNSAILHCCTLFFFFFLNPVWNVLWPLSLSH